MNFIKRHKNTLGGLLINIVDHYSSVLYGYYAPLMAPLFFPSDDPRLTEMRALAVLAITFMMQPVGAFLLGRAGDRYGRKISMILGGLLLALATLLIGLLPGYETLGILAPILLIFALTLQGSGTIAAYNGTAIFLNEFATPKSKAFISGLLVASGFLGAVVASLCGISFTFPESWRVFFLIGGSFGLVFLILRKHLEETPAFKNMLEKEGLKNPQPFFEVLKRRKRNFICTVGIAAGCVLPFYVVCLYFNSFLIMNLGLSQSQTLTQTLIILTLWGIVLPLLGHVGDKVGSRRLMLWSSLSLALLAVPLFTWTFQDLTYDKVTFLRILLSLLSMGMLAPATAYIASLFAVRERERGSGTAYAIGAALFGGTAPFVSHFLVGLTGSPIAPAYYLMACAIATAASVWHARPVREED